MKLTLPQSPIRRVDVFVAGLVAAWNLGWMVLDSSRWLPLARAVRAGPLVQGLPVIILLLLSLLLEANACLGVAWGRPWGFRWMIFLMAMGTLGAVLNPMVHGRSPSLSSAPVVAFELAVLVYCAFRLLRNDETLPETPQGPTSSR